MTTPFVRTSLPASGVASPVPWIWAIVRSSAPSPGPPVGSSVGSSVGSGSDSPPGSVSPFAFVGVGVPAAKSSALFAVLTPFVRLIDVLFEGAGAGPVPAKPAPVATRSTTSGSSAHVPPHPSGPVPSTRATLNPVPPIATAPSTSTVGRSTLPPAPAAWPTRKCPPAGIDPASSVTCQVSPVALAYCRENPSSAIGAVPGLNSSTKSRRRVAPELPPPPYASLMTTGASGETAAVAAPAVTRPMVPIIEALASVATTPALTGC